MRDIARCLAAIAKLLLSAAVQNFIKKWRYLVDDLRGVPIQCPVPESHVITRVQDALVRFCAVLLRCQSQGRRDFGCSFLQLDQRIKNPEAPLHVELSCFVAG
jgi:hypothetical protein